MEYIKWLGTAALCLIITACQTYPNKTAYEAAVCKEMKHRIIFEGATSTERQQTNSSISWQQESQVDRLTQDYKVHCS